MKKIFIFGTVINLLVLCFNIKINLGNIGENIDTHYSVDSFTFFDNFNNNIYTKNSPYNILYDGYNYGICSANVDSCGPGHELGFSSSYINGCRNWANYSFGNYGLSDIPYWINMSSFNSIENETHRNILINDIRYQASIWNEATMYDGSDKIIHLYEVGVGENVLPNKINGKKVVEIMRDDGDYSGYFSSSGLKIGFNYNDSSSSGNRPGRNIDTPMHEFGHLLGLCDLDANGTYGTHKVLMGYNRNTTESNLYDALTYHEIQGIAVINGKHTQHDFNRYFIRNNKFYHVCFFCDLIVENDTSFNSSLPFAEYMSCTHVFQPMVGLKNKRWDKCNKCYQINEHYHNYSYSYDFYDSNQHISRCNCGEFIYEEHEWIRSSTIFNFDCFSTFAVITGPKICRYCGASKLN